MNNKLNSINANVHSIIKWCEHFKTPKKRYLTKEIELDCNSNKELFIKYFKECISFDIYEDTISFIIHQTDEEITEDYEDQLYQKEKFLKELLNKCNLREEYNKQVINYLQRHNLKWLLQELEELKTKQI